MMRADLVLSKHGSPLVVAEAKERPVPKDFERAVMAQLRLYAERTNSRWLLLIDPESLRVYKGKRLTPVAVVPTREITRAAGLTDSETFGERVLLVALERWLAAVPRLRQVARKHPALQEFVDAASEADSIETEFAID